ncbi:hypothetical protein FRX31_021030 [Thalictrum thalictroides]|uniref:Lipoyl-binding domain-containing protein n=1 Tax=Thalictrum thalictroides TaxID=46969 RepID=A0A7J6VX27_THATH|nr:hypothetical protein FRX31_021030 [Thalictrum thalictroides]
MIMIALAKIYEARHHLSIRQNLFRSGERNSPGVIVKVFHLDHHQSRVEVDGLGSDVSFAVYSKKSDLVKDGVKVVEGQPVLVLEAMKMEICSYCQSTSHWICKGLKSLLASKFSTTITFTLKLSPGLWSQEHLASINYG